MYLARVQAAVYNAVVAIEGRYQPYKSSLARRPGASVDAAVAAAAHAILVHDFSSQQANLDEEYAAALKGVPDGDAKTAGIEVGEAAAGELLALREGDGMEADIGFVMPQPGPGVWQLPSGAVPLTPWVSQLQPYLLENPRAVRTEGLDDSLWLRPHRPGVLLAARTYGTEDRLVLVVTAVALLFALVRISMTM